jgi:transposase
MENTAIDYKKLYEESLLTLSEREEELTKVRQFSISKDEQITQLCFELDKFRRYLFGSKSEKLPLQQVDLSQMNLFDLSTAVEQQEELSEQAAAVAEKKAPKKRAKGTGRMALPENLRRETIIIEPKEDVSGCSIIGEEVSEVLDLIPTEFYVIRYVRPKYLHSVSKNIIIGQLPERVIEKGIPSNGLIAQMILDKYVYGLPLHRQIDKYRRIGVNIPASTASDWLIKGWKHLIPLWELVKLLVVSQKYLQADETPIKVQEKDLASKKAIHKGYLWVYNAPTENLVLFDYQKGRDQSGPRTMLKDYSGIIQTDGYVVYESLYANHPKIMLVYCMAHARRKFVDALSYDKKKATEVLELMGLLYILEQNMRDENLDWQQRTQKRQEQAVPILNKIEQWMKNQKYLPSSPLGKAIDYTLPRWKGLCAYAQHGQIEIDNNLVENAIRPVAIGRKNFLFAGSHEAAEMTAAFYSFTATCKKNKVNELEWLTYVLSRIQSHKQKDLYQLLPNNWLKYKTNS